MPGCGLAPETDACTPAEHGKVTLQRPHTFAAAARSAAVECTPLKRALEASYAAVLPKACKPFLFLASLHADIAALFICALR